MPRTMVQEMVFSVLMAFAMVYGMELYNQALMAGGLFNELFLAPLADIVPLAVAVLVLERVWGGPFARHSTSQALGEHEVPPLVGIVIRSCFTCMAMCPAMSLVATVAFKQPALENFIAVWFQTVAMNAPAALLWQLFVAGPAVRFVVKRLPC